MNSPHLYTFINQKPDSRRAWSDFSISVWAAGRGFGGFHVSLSLKILTLQGFSMTSAGLSLIGLSKKSFVSRSGSLRTIYRNSLFSFRQFYHLYPKHRLSPHYETAENSRTDIWIINHCFFHPPDRSTVKTSYFHCLSFLSLLSCFMCIRLPTPEWAYYAMRYSLIPSVLYIITFRQNPEYRAPDDSLRASRRDPWPAILIRSRLLSTIS